MKCPSCSAELPDDARFCIECGVSLDRGTTGPTVHLKPGNQAPAVCVACGAHNPSHALFCVRCGQRMGTSALHPNRVPQMRSNEIDQSAPSLPSFRPPPRRTVGQQRDWEVAGIAIFLIGLGLLLFSKAFWPGILIVIGLANFMRVASRGRIIQGMRNIFWLFGLAFLFMMPRLFFPGIFVLVALSALLEAMIFRQWKP